MFGSLKEEIICEKPVKIYFLTLNRLTFKGFLFSFVAKKLKLVKNYGTLVLVLQ